MITKLQQNVMALFANNIHEQYTIREISQKLKKYYANVYDAIQLLIDSKILIKKRIGRADVCSVNLNQEKTVSLLVLGEELRRDSFRKKYLNITILLNEIISKFEKYSAFFCLVVFGSYASMTARENSDLDLLIMLPNLKYKNDFIKEINAIQITSSIKINPIIVTEREFAEMLRDKADINVGKETLKKHILFFNSQVYWQMVKNEIFSKLENAKREAITLIESLERAKTLRNEVNYELKDLPRIQTAKEILEDAKIFVSRMKEIVFV